MQHVQLIRNGHTVGTCSEAHVPMEVSNLDSVLEQRIFAFEKTKKGGKRKCLYQLRDNLSKRILARMGSQLESRQAKKSLHRRGEVHAK
eukprot:1767295-Amphidinium_carterae.1